MRKGLNARYLLWLAVMALVFAFSSAGSATAFARGGKALPGAASNDQPGDQLLAAPRRDGAAAAKMGLPAFIPAPSFTLAGADAFIMPARMFDLPLPAPLRLFSPRAPPVVSI
jgi:hypothetical protein